MIRSKLDVVIQDENLSESQSNIIQGAYDAIEKLARLNEAMLLLVKIENKQYSRKDKLQLDNIVWERFYMLMSFFKQRDPYFPGYKTSRDKNECVLADNLFE